MGIDTLKEPVAARPEEVPQIQKLKAVFSTGAPELQYYLADSAGNRMALPKSMFQVLVAVAHAMADGQPVSIVHNDQALTTQQAADLLQVSRPYLIQLLDQEKIEYKMVGTHRRIRMADVMDYKHRRDEVRKDALKALGDASEGLGLYDEEDGGEAD